MRLIVAATTYLILGSSIISIIYLIAERRVY
jgi:hypothetical protein